MPELPLPGCTPEPLMSYLKALGVFRLVAEQADPDARGSWVGGTFVLQSKLDRDGLIRFFTEDYRPTPILAPWNGGSGFYGGGAEPLDALVASSAGRLTLYRETIGRVRPFVPPGKPKDEGKERLLTQCRAVLPDEVIPWLDTCFVLGEDGPGYFPLLGTGGNDGRLDFTNNFMQRLADIIAFGEGDPQPDDSVGWLADAIFADGLTALGKAAVGQFNPGGIGGANGVQGKYDAASRVNPWDYVLTLEGAIPFAGAVARRLGTDARTNARAAFPFTVQTVAVGYASATASEETSDGSRAELWLPLWEEPAAFREVERLFVEGRAQLGRRQARNSVEFALAIGLLGVGRGVTAFSRYGFLKRNGLAFIAAPLGRIRVTPRPSARLLDDPALTTWLDRLRSACRDKEKVPGRYHAALRGIDRAMFEFANRAETGAAADGRALTNVLIALGHAERTLSGGLRFCEDKYIRPLQGLDAQWLDRADDDSPEFRLAAAVASILPTKDVGPFRCFLEPVEARGSRFTWDGGSTSAVWSNRSLADNLAAVFRRRSMEAFRAGRSGVPLDSPRPAALADAIAFVEGETNDDKLHELIWGLSAVAAAERREPTVLDDDSTVPFEFGVPRLVVGSIALKPYRGRWGLADRASDRTATADAAVFQMLARNVSSAVDAAARRLKAGGLLVNGYRNRRQSGQSLAIASAIPPVRLLAAMLFPLSERDLLRVANEVLYPPESDD